MAEHDFADFDAWYQDVIASPERDRLVADWLQLPDGLESTGYLTGPGLDEVVGGLGLGPGAVLVDLGCGRGGYGLAAARVTGASLVGVDFSAVAVTAARAAAERLGLSGRASFVVGDLMRTGLADEAGHAAICIDSIHFAASVPVATAEIRRVLVPGGRLVLTTWQARHVDDEAMPVRIRKMDIERDLLDAGFVNVDIVDRPDWQAAEVACWRAAAATDLQDAGLRALREDAELFLPLAAGLRRVLVTANSAR